MTIGVNIKRKTSLSQRCFLFLLVATVVEVNQYLTPRSSPGRLFPRPIMKRLQTKISEASTG